MCGIAGVADFTGRPVEAGLIVAMCDAIRHRGPDDEGILRLGCSGESGQRAAVALGSRRLSIIDVSGGHQPIANEDRSVWVVMNGEIYNFLELREELEANGHRFSTKSDTEVIVHLYEDRGEDFVASLDGMFALALWDERRQTLHLARDRFGKKPLLYAEANGRLSFASEFRALLVDPSVSREMDRQALDYYLTYMSVPSPHTIYQRIRRVPPAHVLTIDRGGARLRPYWTLQTTPKLQMREEPAVERVRKLLTGAVKRRLISEVPLGAFLSGGIDSSAVVALMASLSNRPIKTFSIGFEESTFNELPHARRVANLLHCDHHEFVVRPRAIEILPTLVRHFGEPFADSSAIPTYYLSRLTREHVTVALNGDGGDEVFGGYDRHVGYRLAEAWQRMPGPLQRAVAALSRRIPAGADARRPLARLARFLASAPLSRSARYESWVGVVSQELKAELLTAKLSTGGDNGPVEGLFSRYASDDAVDAVLAVDTLFYLPTDLLVKVDITSMANSLEARSPFLDHHLVEFVARLPSDFKVRGRTTKHILKRAVAGLVPPENIERRKRGFAVPIAEWFRGELREFLSDHLLSRRSAQRGLFRARSVEGLVSAHVERRADHAHQLWVLLMLELWHREFIDGAA